VAAGLRDQVDRLDLIIGRVPQRIGLDLLVVLGGDGAAHQAVQSCAGTSTALGLVPVGNGNDLARALKVPLEPLRALDALITRLRSGQRRHVDLGQVGDRWFATVLCAGFDAAVSHRAARLRWPAGPHRYDLAVVAELARFAAKPVRIRTDADSLEVHATLVAVGNTACYGGGIPICPAARPDDGLFDVTVVGKASRADLIRMLPALRTGAHLAHPAVRTLRAREISLAGNDWPVSADGEDFARLPVLARCVPAALTVLS
jgi:diacylglycerol kinase (ATP)